MSSGLHVGEPGDVYEQEADRVADEVMSGGPLKRHWSLAGPGRDTSVRRKCTCGASGGAQGECEKCREEKEAQTLQRKAAGAAESDVAPPIVHEVLNSPGQALDQSTRDYFEPRFGYDFGHVRVHADATAHKSATAVNALAYTLGSDIVFGYGRYSPSGIEGRRLLAHELAHTIQQRAVLSRQTPPEHLLPPHDPTAHTPAAGACDGSAVCANLKTPSKLMAEQKSDPANKSKRDHRRLVCGHRPPDPACTADGHGAPATQAAKLLHKYDASRPPAGVKMLLDKDMESGFGALTMRCDSFVPPVTGATTCIAIPEDMEKQAETFNNTADPTIGGMERGKWRERTLEILVHESEHARFRAATSAGTLLAHTPSCFTSDVKSAMSELAAMLTEFRLRMERIRGSVSLTSSADRAQEMNEWRKHRIEGTSQSITVSLRTARCACNCADADKMIKETVEFATASWTQQEKNDLHREMRDPRWHDLNLRWPFVAPPIPSVHAL